MNLKFNTIVNNRLANLEIFPAFATREIGIRRRNRHTNSTPFDLTPLLESFECLSTDKYSIVGEDDGTLVPPLACEFCKVSSASHVLALADENGYLVLHNTRKTGSETEIKDWQAHSNAIFDISWAEQEEKLVTAAGDQTAVLWDIHRCEKVDVYKGHNSSIKSVTFRRQDDAVFATGSRDGHIMIWDRRCTKKDGHIPPVNSIHNAHTLSAGIKQRRKSKLGPALDSQQSVTSVAFQSDVYLASAGAVDGMIKVWDLRKNYAINSAISQPRFMYPYQGTSIRKHGFSSIVFDSTGTRLFASATDDNIYQYDFASYTQPPVACYRGHKNNTFYIKTALSPDNKFLLSGSSDDNAYIWQVDRPYSSPVILKGHWAEVTGVSWNELDFGKIATISDDCTMRLWRLHRRTDPPRQGEVSGTAEKTHKEIGVGSTVTNHMQCSPNVTTSQMASSDYYSPSLWRPIPVTPGKSLTPAVHGLKTITPSKDRKLSMKPPSNVTPSSKQSSSPTLTSPSIKDWFQFRSQQNDTTENRLPIKSIKDDDKNSKACSGKESTAADELKITPLKRGLDRESGKPLVNSMESKAARHNSKRPNCKRKLIQQDSNEEHPTKRTNILHDVTNNDYSVDSKMHKDVEGCLSVSEKFSKNNADVKQSPTMKLPNLVDDQMVTANNQRGKENTDGKDKTGKLDWLTMLRIQRLKDQYPESLEKTPEKIKLPSGMRLPNNITPNTSPCRNVASPSRLQESPVRGMKSIKNYFGAM